MLMKRCLLLALIVLGILIPASAQTIFNCSSGFVTANTTCGVGYNGTGGYQFQFAQDPNGVILGTAANLIPVAQMAAVTTGAGLMYQTRVNAQAFTANFTFVANGKNVAFVLAKQQFRLQETRPIPNTSRAARDARPDSIRRLQVAIHPGQQYLCTGAGSILSANKLAVAFTYSSAQIYQQVEAPCHPPYTSGNGTTYGTTFSPTKLSTSPVPLNSPAGTR